MSRISSLPFATRAEWTGPHDPRLLLVLSLADDELAIGHRHSHWTGVAPTLESDLAFSSLAQDEIGHAVLFYGVASELTGDDEDALAFGRQPEAYRHAVLLEREPRDWAFSLARQHAYDLFDAVRLDVLGNSADQSLSGLLGAIVREERLHRAHARAWLERVAGRHPEGRARMVDAIRRVLAEAGGLVEPLPGEEQLVAEGVLPVGSGEIAARWRERLEADYARYGLAEEVLDAFDVHGGLGGRHGRHSDEWRPMWEEMTKLYREHPGASW